MTDIIVFQNAFLIDGNGGDPLPAAALVVEAGAIKEVIREGGLAKLPGSRIIDLNGKTLMPGLIDAHVHPGNVEWTLEKTAKLPPAV